MASRHEWSDITGSIAMDISNLERASMRLDTHALLRIQDGAGQGVAVVDGMVWITQDGDPRDVFVAGGQSFRLDRPGLTIVQALEPTRLLMLAG
jgi:hypothetical protein